MIQQLFKLMWNSKRNHSLLIIEIFFSFLVLFGVFSLLIYQYGNYQRPMGFKGDNVWVVWFENANAESGTLNKQRQTLLNRVRAFDEVEHASVSGNAVPFGGTTNGHGLTYQDLDVHSEFLSGDNDYAKVLEIPLIEGRWFQKEDEALDYEPIVLNQNLRNELFGTNEAVGQNLDEEGSTPKKVVGVIGNFKYKGDFQHQKNVAISRTPKDRFSSLLVKVKEGTTAEFEGILSKTISTIAKGYQIEIERLSDKRKMMNNVVLIPGIILLSISGFLILNVVLGLFGILWSNINKRKGEIGTRRAMGATKRLITTQFIGEVLVIATFALIIGCFFAIQFPLMNMFGLENGVYFKAIITAISTIYSLVIICAFYPSWQASKIHPAIALHAD